MKKFISICLCFFIVFAMTVPAFAGDIDTCSNNVKSTDISFSISNSGNATVVLKYYGKSRVTQKAEISTKIQKKVGVIWVTVSNGSWTDTSSSTNFSTSHSVQLSSKATYRAHVVFTISGSGGSDDKITKNSAMTYK